MKKNKFEILFVFQIIGVSGHGILWDPPNRSSLWRFGYETPVNYDDSQYYCGGIEAQMSGKLKCGLCGDPYEDPMPRSNENGGLYGSGIITKVYNRNQIIPVTVNLMTEHKGYFEFHLCNLDKKNETEDCFVKLKFENRSFKHSVSQSQFYYMRVIPLKNLKCQHCVLRWHYNTGNNWGTCKDGTQGLGCGPQEIYRNCADISIK